MKKRLAQFSLAAVFLITVLGAVCLSGCETAKGLGRDIKSADDWIRDNLW